MDFTWLKISIILVCYPILISSISIDSLYLDLIHQNISDFSSFNNFYKDFLHDTRQHRIIDTVSSPINLKQIQSNNYTENYLKNSCYETASDLLVAHGYDTIDLKLSKTDLQSLLPAILNTVENPGCQRQLPPIKQHPFFNGWILGLLSIIIMKIFHLLTFFIAGDHSSALTSTGISRTLSNSTGITRNSNDEIRFSPSRYHLWLGLGFNAFTCGIILGTVIYHLIPHIYEIPNEDFDYTYLLRGTVVLCGVFLFFIVEKLLRFRFKVDEMHFEGVNDDKHETSQPTDESMIQMAKMHGTFHVQHSHPESPLQSSIHADSADEETNLPTNHPSAQIKRHSSHFHDSQVHNMILYHIIYDFTNDIIYGCGLATAVSHDYFIGFVLWLMILSEGFRRHSQLLSSLGRKLGFNFLFISIIFLIIGYIIGGVLIQINQQITFLQKEYVYSIVYGALFYTALVTLIPELNDFGQHLQDIIKTENQTSKQRRLLKTFILICQNLFLIIGVLIALVLAIIWRYYHRMQIYQYVCKRDPLRIFCPSHH